YSSFFYFFFFFQAEDGIRDLTVTGVQTCALPILVVRADLQPGDAVLLLAQRRQHHDRRAAARPDPPAHLEPVDARQHQVQHDDRSEERRVGKEGRGRGWEDSEKKKKKKEKHKDNN